MARRRTQIEQCTIAAAAPWSGVQHVLAQILEGLSHVGVHGAAGGFGGAVAEGGPRAGVRGRGGGLA